jgi:hypothetical protein
MLSQCFDCVSMRAVGQRIQSGLYLTTCSKWLCWLGTARRVVQHRSLEGSLLPDSRCPPFHTTRHFRSKSPSA